MVLRLLKGQSVHFTSLNDIQSDYKSSFSSYSMILSLIMSQLVHFTGLNDLTSE